MSIIDIIKNVIFIGFLSPLDDISSKMRTRKVDGPWAGKPFTNKPIGVIVHAMAERIAGLSGPEFLKSIGLSVHACIEPDGTVLLCSPITQVAYHAGKSQWQGIVGLNSSFLGVELLLKGEHDYDSFVKAINSGNPYTPEQYVALAELCRSWYLQLEWNREIILGHSQVSGADVRPDPKQDPGKAFKWDKFWSEYNKLADK